MVEVAELTSSVTGDCRVCSNLPVNGRHRRTVSDHYAREHRLIEAAALSFFETKRISQKISQKLAKNH